MSSGMKSTGSRKNSWGEEFDYEFPTPLGTTRSLRIAGDSERGCLNISAIDGLEVEDVDAFCEAVQLAARAASKETK